MRLRNLSFSSDNQASGLTPGVPPTAGPAIPAIDPELSSIRDRAIFLLHTAAEIEHALLVQYLYAYFTAPAGSKIEWTRNILTIAIQEMGHLITVQNVLLAMRAPLNLEREDFPFRRGYYPFEFSLDPFSLKTLARYTLAEMPSTGNGLGAEELATLNKLADVTAGVSNVPPLYDLMIDTVSQVDPSEFLGDTTLDLQAMPGEW
ncbi:MAG: ferritin-like domain-containing protein, partial [Candidatus Solibacter sp.]